MRSIKVLALTIALGLAGVVYAASGGGIQSKTQSCAKDKANASCCASGASSCCKGGSCPTKHKSGHNHSAAQPSGTDDKDACCCQSGAACCTSHKAGEQQTATQADATTHEQETDCCTASACCCAGGACCTKQTE